MLADLYITSNCHSFGASEKQVSGVSLESTKTAFLGGEKKKNYGFSFQPNTTA